MGLPSGVQWASCNVGAGEPSDLGLYFSWGNVEGHAIDEEYDFTQQVYNSTPAASIDTNLSLDQDAARSYLGAPWRMPTAAEFQELFDNCTIEWRTLHGVNGSLFISNINGNRIFIPAAGSFSGTSLSGRGKVGDYWSSTFDTATNAFIMNFGSAGGYPQLSSSRRLGFSVRAVLQTT